MGFFIKRIDNRLKASASRASWTSQRTKAVRRMAGGDANYKSSFRHWKKRK